ARARKDFRESDRIRDQLAAMGIAIKDSKEGTTWEIARWRGASLSLIRCLACARRHPLPQGDRGKRSEGFEAMGQTLPKPALRPYLATDAPMLATIFVAAIEELTGDDYSEAQQEAWAAVADDEEFGRRLAADLTLIATLQDSPVGFASLRGKDHIR